MATKFVFWEDPYLTEIQAKVTSVNKGVVTLDQTIAFAFSGGQQSDSGTIGGYEILEARKEGNVIFYTLPQNHGLAEGDGVTVRIDWDKRYRLMKLHFAAELVLESVYQSYNFPQKVGANITVDKARVDFMWKGNISEIFPALLNRINHLIECNLDIASDFSEVEEGIRYWAIEGFAKVPCGGTHLKRTGEIGPVALKRSNIGSGKERIEIYLKG